MMDQDLNQLPYFFFLETESHLKFQANDAKRSSSLSHMRSHKAHDAASLQASHHADLQSQLLDRHYFYTLIKNHTQHGASECQFFELAS